MTINFLKEQTRAKRKTAALVLHFMLGFLTVTVSVFLAMALMLIFFTMGKYLDSAGFWRVVVWTSGIAGSIVILIMIWAILWTMQSLRKGGGKAVAQSLGGRLVPPGTTDLKEQRLLNVMEEMALASGLPVPPVYVLDKQASINALAAGFDPQCAVVILTRGALEQLNREELEGVMGHEFSHIINGDMRLNIRLMGLTSGILALKIMGDTLYDVSLADPKHVFSRSFSMGLVAGTLLKTIGYGGTYHAKRSLAAVSREREFLADAASVQFTRNPTGLCNALVKIARNPNGSRIQHRLAHRVSHMLFDQGQGSPKAGPLATHPLIEERILRLDPSFQRELLAPVQADTLSKAAQEPTAAGAMAGQGQTLAAPQPPAPKGTLANDTLLAYPDPLRQAQEIIAALPMPIREATQRIESAQAVVLGLLVLHAPLQNQELLALLPELTNPPIHETTVTLLPDLQAVPEIARLPLIDLCIPALRQMTPETYQAFLKAVHGLISSDRRMDLTEWALSRLLLRRLDGHFRLGPRKGAPKVFSLTPVQQECAVLLAVLAGLGRDDAHDQEQAFNAGTEALGLPDLTQPAQEERTLAAADQALAALNQLDQACKDSLLKACAACVTADQEVTVQQGELLRVIADSLGRPMPPFAIK